MTHEDTPPRPTNVRQWVLAALCFITIINYVQRNAFGGVETRIQSNLGADAADMGDAKSDFFLAYSLFQIPSGWLAQRWGGRRALTFYSAGWSIMVAVMAGAPNLTILRLSRIGLGIFQAGIFPSSTMILYVWYPASQRGFATAMLNSFMLIGGALVSVTTGLLIEPLGWRLLFLVYAAPGLLAALLFFLWFRDRPGEHPGVNEAERKLLASDALGVSPKVERRSSIPWLSIFLSWALWMICLQQFCRAGALRFFDQTLPTYLQTARNQDISDANLLTSIPLLGGVLGGLVGGRLSDWVLVRTGSRRAARQGVAIASTATALACYALAYAIPNLTAAVWVVGIGVFVTSFASPCSYALTMDMGGRNLGIIFGAMNMAGNLGAWAFLKFLPRVVDSRGWDTALLGFAAMHVVAIACWLLLNPNGVIGERVPREERP